MAKPNLASILTGRRIQALSSPTLVAIVRRLIKEHVVFKLTHAGQEPPNGPWLRAATDELKKRNITINHPECSSEPDPDPDQ